MKCPIILKELDAKRIAWIITQDNRKHRNQHLLADRLERLEKAAGHSLRDDKDIHIFLEEFLTGSSLFFSYLYIRAKIPDNVESIGVHRFNNYFKYIGNLFSTKEINYKFNHIINEREIYVYCVKKSNVLILSGIVKGKLSPALWTNLWNISFDFQGITFRGFRKDADRITEKILNNKYLNKYNRCLTSSFSIFKAQTLEIEEHKECELIDSQAINSLSEFENMLLRIYLSIFDRYSDQDDRILSECDIIYNIYKDNSSEESPQWIISSPSYSLPIWFEDFYNALCDDDRLFLKQLDLNSFTEEEIMHIVDILKLFRSSIMYKSNPIKG
jgi:hypothetical protein